MAAFAGAWCSCFRGAADDGEAIEQMPWRVIVMVCGVTRAHRARREAQGLDLMVSLVARISTPDTVTGVVAFLTGLVSVYSSTSGVVLPAFCRSCPGLAAALPGASAVAIAMSMNIGGHLVDVSPLSTIGALCMAGAAGADSRKLFIQLLAWGLSMAVVGAVLCYVIVLTWRSVGIDFQSALAEAMVSRRPRSRRFDAMQEPSGEKLGEGPTGTSAAVPAALASFSAQRHRRLNPRSSPRRPVAGE